MVRHRIHGLNLLLPYTSSSDYNCIQKDQSVFWFPSLSHENHSTIYHPREQLFMLPVNGEKQTNKPTNHNKNHKKNKPNPIPPPPNQYNKHKTNFLCVTQTSYLHFRAT